MKLPRYGLKRIFLLTAFVAVSLGWFLEHQKAAESQERLRAIEGQLKQIKLVTVLETNDSILAGRSRGGLNREGIWATQTVAIDIDGSRKAKEIHWSYKLWVRDWESEEALAMLTYWWGEESVRANSPQREIVDLPPFPQQ